MLRVQVKAVSFFARGNGVRDLAQVVAELRARAERMHNFSDLEEVEACLRGLMSREPDPLVTRLERHAGMKEPRYAHLLSGQPAINEDGPAAAAGSARGDRIAALEAEVVGLKDQMRRLEEQFERFRKQFE